MGKYANPRKPLREGKKIVVGAADAVPVGRGATVELAGGAEVALFNANGRLYAIENFCPHKGAPLADGALDGNLVACELHGWQFDVRTGECLEKKRDCSIEAYEVIIEDGMIKILI